MINAGGLRQARWKRCGSKSSSRLLTQQWRAGLCYAPSPERNCSSMADSLVSTQLMCPADDLLEKPACVAAHHYVGRYVTNSGSRRSLLHGSLSRVILSGAKLSRRI